MSLRMIGAYFLRPPLPLSLDLPDLVVPSGLGLDDAVAAVFSLSVEKHITEYRLKCNTGGGAYRQTKDTLDSGGSGKSATYHAVALHQTFSNIDQAAVYVNQPEHITS